MQGFEPRVWVGLVTLLAAAASTLAGVQRDPYLVPSSRARPSAYTGGGGGSRRLSIPASSISRSTYRASSYRHAPRGSKQLLVFRRTLGLDRVGQRKPKWRFLGYLNSSFTTASGKLALKLSPRPPRGKRKDVVPPLPRFGALAPANSLAQAASPLKGIPDWDYDEKGPLTWATRYPGCAGRRQSPINIRSARARVNKRGGGRVAFQPTVSGFSVEYDGASVKLTPEAPISMAGIGRYGDRYTVGDIHFHWASNSYEGSEHAINGVRYPMEMHLTSFLSKYRTKKEAIKHTDGLAALSIMFDIGEENPSLWPILRASTRLLFVGDKVPFPSMNLRGLFPDGLHSFFRYPGSMTTPPCRENVLWTVCNNIQTLSRQQLFQDLRRGRLARGGSGINDNCRPVQPSHNRPIVFDV